jgi:peptidyl-dipeptidase A
VSGGQWGGGRFGIRCHRGIHPGEKVQGQKAETSLEELMVGGKKANGCLTILLGCWLALVGAAYSSQEEESETRLDPGAAASFLEEAENRLLELVIELARAQWVQATYITEDSEILAARAYERMIGAAMEYADEATRFDGLDLPYDTSRRLKLLKIALTLPAPSDAEERAELTRIAASLESTYGKGKYCPENRDCRDLSDLSRLLAESRDPEALLEAWVGWRTISPSMRSDYRRFVELGNKGARELGFSDLGALWRSKYDMDPDELRVELDRLWRQVSPLYEALHCHVRAKLSEHYGSDVVPPDDSIPGHVLGNMWAQSWSNIYSLVAPENVDPGFDLTALLEEKGVDALEMVRYGERFFTSLGIEPLPETFWERSLFTKPADREVMCHASAWDIDQVDDLRIKMCIEINDEDFSTVHRSTTRISPPFITSSVTTSISGPTALSRSFIVRARTMVSMKASVTRSPYR